MEGLRVKASCAFMISGALEVQAQIAREIDPELHKLLIAAHGHCLHVMAQARDKLRDARRELARMLKPSSVWTGGR
jgi:hypothetical protein